MISTNYTLRGIMTLGNSLAIEEKARSGFGKIIIYNQFYGKYKWPILSLLRYEKSKKYRTCKWNINT